jgi:hypothetical protein
MVIGLIFGGYHYDFAATNIFLDELQVPPQEALKLKQVQMVDCTDVPGVMCEMAGGVLKGDGFHTLAMDGSEQSCPVVSKCVNYLTFQVVFAATFAKIM